jgi:FKBP-type peptidyl-prolyl cis-trans isomerase FkpA
MLARQIPARQIPAQGMLARRGWLAVAGGLAAAILGFAGCVQQPTFRPGPADPDAPSEFTQTPSGLRYRILRKGEGDPPKASDTVRVHYVGKLDDGSEFDSSYRTGKPAEFSLSGVVKGWTEGLQLVQPGGMIELQVPPELGYGRDGVPGAIPPGATLNFTVELIEIL